jgi:hypothetical protein
MCYCVVRAAPADRPAGPAQEKEKKGMGLRKSFQAENKMGLPKEIENRFEIFGCRFEFEYKV